uniref:Uncharacterized protein n=1 Tax=Panagrolaimus sp. JU765 TaxID=591449 RepID=A0AC34RTB2_9BILA
MALFASPFGQPQSFGKIFSLAETQDIEFCEIDQNPSPTMKRKRVNDNVDDQPGPKRRHYEDRMARRLDSLDLSAEGQKKSSSEDDELCIQEIDPETLTDSPVMFDIDEDSQQPIIEEPEDDSEGLVLSDELRHFMQFAKNKPLLPKMNPVTTGRELVIWRPPSLISSSEEDSDSLNSRIQEIPEDVDIEDEPLTPMEDSPDAEVTFPDGGSSASSSRSSSSPPLATITLTTDTNTGYNSSSSSSSDGNTVFRLRQTSNASVKPQINPDTEEEPMDLG